MAGAGGSHSLPEQETYILFAEEQLSQVDDSLFCSLDLNDFP